MQGVSEHTWIRKLEGGNCSVWGWLPKHLTQPKTPPRPPRRPRPSHSRRWTDLDPGTSPVPRTNVPGIFAMSIMDRRHRHHGGSTHMANLGNA